MEGKRADLLKTRPPEELTFTVKGNEFGEKIDETTLAVVGDFTLKTTTKPKRIDIQFRPRFTRTYLGIYELAGDSLKICLALDLHGKRPASLGTRPGEMNVLLEFRRAKP